MVIFLGLLTVSELLVNASLRFRANSNSRAAIASYATGDDHVSFHLPFSALNESRVPTKAQNQAANMKSRDVDLDAAFSLDFLKQAIDSTTQIQSTLPFFFRDSARVHRHIVFVCMPSSHSTPLQQAPYFIIMIEVYSLSFNSFCKTLSKYSSRSPGF